MRSKNILIISCSQTAEHKEHNVESPTLPDVNAKPFVPSVSQKQDNRQGVFPVNQKVARPTAPPPDRQQNNASQSIHTDNAQVCYYHQTSGDKARMCRERKVATLVSGEPIETRHDYAEATFPTLSPSRLLYVADKINKCNYLIDMGAAVSVLPYSCANRTADTSSLPLVTVNNTTITTYLPTYLLHANE